MAELLVEASIHNNTNGQFSAFYKGEDGIGKFGGKKEIDLRRILAPIILQNPILSSSPCNVNISRMDTNEWVKKSSKEKMSLEACPPPGLGEWIRLI